MADKITVSKEYLSKVVETANEAVPRLEKLASYEDGLQKYAEEASQSLVDAGLVDPSARKDIIQDIVEGGMPKVAELHRFVISKVGVPVEPMGKQASDNSREAPKTSDDIWRENFPPVR